MHLKKGSWRMLDACLSLCSICLLVVPQLCAEQGVGSIGSVAQWPLAEDARNYLADTNHGQVIGEASFNDGVLNLAGGYVTFGNDSSLSGTGGVSFCLWINPSENDRIMRVLGKFQKENDKEYCLFIDESNRVWSFFSDNGTAEKEHAIVQTTTDPAITSGEWQHLAVTWEPTKGAKVYVNGNALQTVSAQESNLATLHAGSADLTLGAYDIGNGQLTNTFHGSVSSLTLVQGTLSASDIKEIYTQDAPSFAARKGEKSLAGQQESNQGTEQSGQQEGTAKQSATGFHYVDALQGDDSFSGAHDSVVDRQAKKGPLKTINAALRRARPGDTVIVAKGIYAEKVRLCGVRLVTNGRVELE